VRRGALYHHFANKEALLERTHHLTVEFSNQAQLVLLRRLTKEAGKPLDQTILIRHLKRLRIHLRVVAAALR
jgi:AcrR family transcriptional regulator